MSLCDVFVIHEDRASDRRKIQRMERYYSAIIEASKSARLTETQSKGYGMVLYKYEIEVLKKPVVLLAALNVDPTANGIADLKIGPFTVWLQNAGTSSHGGVNWFSIEFRDDDLMGDGLEEYGIKKFGEDMRKAWPEALTSLREMMMHELVHAFDHEELGVDYHYAASYNNPVEPFQSEDEYYTTPLEKNANDLQAIQQVAAQGLGDSAQEFASRVVSYMHQLRSSQYLQGDQLRKIQKRASTYWQHLKDQEKY